MIWPAPVIENAEHVLIEDGWCWCQPKVEHVLPMGEVVIHRHFWDRPEYCEETDG